MRLRHQHEGSNGEHRRRGEDVETPRIRNPGGHQGSGHGRTQDGAKAAHARGKAQRRPPQPDREELADPGIDQDLGAEDEHAGDKHRSVEQELVLDLHAEHREEDGGEAEPEEHDPLGAVPVRQDAGNHEARHGAHVEHQQQGKAGVERCSRRMT